MRSWAFWVVGALALMSAAGTGQAQVERKHIEDNSTGAHKAVGADQTAAHRNPTAAAHLVLSDAERVFVLDSVDVQGDSTLALGFLTVGADVPRTIELKGFPQAVLAKVSKLKDYKYFSAEGRIAIVDPSHARVEMVIEPRN
jgi:hypothetical protein